MLLDYRLTNHQLTRSQPGRKFWRSASELHAAPSHHLTVMSSSWTRISLTRRYVVAHNLSLVQRDIIIYKVPTQPDDELPPPTAPFEEVSPDITNLTGGTDITLSSSPAPSLTPTSCLIALLYHSFPRALSTRMSPSLPPVLPSRLPFSIPLPTQPPAPIPKPEPDLILCQLCQSERIMCPPQRRGGSG